VRSEFLNWSEQEATEHHQSTFASLPVGHYFREYDEGVNLTIDLDREDDGRWIAEALELPGVMCYGQTRDEAISNAERLAIEVIADRIAHGELPSSALAVSFAIPDEQLARQ
jgi:predicted RNase H-like HicB family nuclease